MNKIIRTILLIIIIFTFHACTHTETEYHPNGAVKSIITYKGKKEHGLMTYYRVDGVKELEINMVNGKKEGEMTRWFNANNIESKTHYKNDLKDGVEILYSIDGYKIMETSYKEGKKHGYYATWHNKDQIKEEGAFWNDLFDGQWNYYDQRGFPVGEANFNKGAGEQIAFDLQGNLMQITTYRDNKKNGKEIEFNPKGDTIRITIFENERILDQQEFKQ